MPSRWAAAVLLPFDWASACWMAFRSSKDKFKTPADKPILRVGRIVLRPFLWSGFRRSILQLRGKMMEAYAGGITHDDAMFHGRAEFTNVSRPLVIPDGFKGVPGEGLEFLVFPWRIPSERRWQAGGCLHGVPEGGHLNMHHIEAEVEVFPEFPFLHKLFQ